MNLRSAPLLLALGCSPKEEVLNVPEPTIQERDSLVEADLRSELINTLGACDAVFDARPSYYTDCPPESDLKGHQVLQEGKGYVDGNYHIGTWTFCEYQDGRHVDDASVKGYCKDFLKGENWRGHIPTGATPQLNLEEGLRKELPKYSYR